MSKPRLKKYVVIWMQDEVERATIAWGSSPEAAAERTGIWAKAFYVHELDEDDKAIVYRTYVRSHP